MTKLIVEYSDADFISLNKKDTLHVLISGNPLYAIQIASVYCDSMCSVLDYDKIKGDINPSDERSEVRTVLQSLTNAHPSTMVKVYKAMVEGNDNYLQLSPRQIPIYKNIFAMAKANGFLMDAVESMGEGFIGVLEWSAFAFEPTNGWLEALNFDVKRLGVDHIDEVKYIINISPDKEEAVINHCRKHGITVEINGVKYDSISQIQ